VSLRTLLQGPLPITAPLYGPAEKAMLSAIGLEKLLSVERATVEKDQT
jgi:hypothetical protein